MKMLKVLAVFIMVVGLACTAFAAEEIRTAKVIDIEGDVEIKMADGSQMPAEIGMVITQGDIVKTKGDSWALVKLEGIETATVEIDENAEVLLSQLTMDEDAGTQQTLLDLAIGKVLIKAEKVQDENSKFQVKTPTSIVGVRGTTFQVTVEGLE
jgi:hypothetical protein